jgi:hypothetical protein
MLPLRVLLSAVTLFGGHVLNRRPERVLQILGLLAILGIVYSILPSLLFREPSDVHRMDTAFSGTALALICIALLSAALTWKDARSPASPALSLISRMAGAAASLFGFLLIGLATLVFLSSIGIRSFSVTRSSESYSRSPPRLTYAVAQLGGEIRYGELRRAPAGPHPLRGRILKAGQPVAAAEVQLTLNGTFRSETVTNQQGEFAISLPAGPWTINQLTVMNWDETPEGTDLLLFSEHENRRSSVDYSRVPPRESPVRIDLPMRPDLNLPTFEMRPSIAMHWPPSGPRDPDASSEAPVANPATDAIRWTPVPGAAEYEIQVRILERGKEVTRAETLLARRQGGIELPLAGLPQQPQDSAEPSEYSVVVYAFDAEGTLLSQSIDGFENAFRLAGKTRLAKEARPTSLSPDDDSQYMRNLGRLSLVHSLLEYDQLDAARAILKEVGDSAPPGRKAAMQGAIEAMSGNCAAAIPLLDQADREGGTGCAPMKYRAMCLSNTR